MKCEKLNRPSNGFMWGCEEESISYGATCLFYCEPGYKAVSGTKERHCQEDGTWSGSPLTCQGKLSIVTVFQGLILINMIDSLQPLRTRTQTTPEQGPRLRPKPRTGTGTGHRTTAGPWTRTRIQPCIRAWEPVPRNISGNFLAL